MPDPVPMLTLDAANAEAEGIAGNEELRAGSSDGCNADTVDLGA